MFKGKLLLFSFMLVFATSLHAGDVDMCLSDCGVSCVGMRVSICPAGDFEFIRTGCGGCCDYIWVCTKDADGNGVPLIPWSDYWLNACGPGQELCLCANSILADSLSNEDGCTTFSTRIAGGGCILTGGMYVAVQGKVIVDEPDCIDVTCLDVVIVSPDHTADCRVNLSDLAVFGMNYNKACGDPGYNDCCDYNDDCVCNLSDFAYMGAHYGHTCF